ncbi:hypothetical protein Srot_2847 [Segniliparus rotundus DSM 44985]|uniref:DUF2537 domain-containing protein n=1 Tax=Segniliparus rotundus (strain ATCC BAA-972 / CDC 1076 / CIP 108378 / DSM 44985 / JCM 13578) TaxID=640132 RepID=D6ZDM1_SEGRD|nr:DUF2537 domain-containing protein [Segniliparus rotundus]ADG99278.1 hypothetical protein Srot_2847 [Segniliparus rotundus DSM 44985]
MVAEQTPHEPSASHDHAAPDGFEGELIEPDVVPVGFALAIYSAAVTAVVVVAVTRGLLALQLAFPIGIALALVVNIGVTAGVMPAMQVWRRVPVLRWLVWGSWAGAFVGWALVIVLAALDAM